MKKSWTFSNEIIKIGNYFYGENFSGAELNASSFRLLLLPIKRNNYFFNDSVFHLTFLWWSLFIHQVSSIITNFICRTRDRVWQNQFCGPRNHLKWEKIFNPRQTSLNWFTSFDFLSWIESPFHYATLPGLVEKYA
jgi:hypothetical protein